MEVIVLQRTLISFDMDTQYAIFWGNEHLFILTWTQYADFRENPLCQATKEHLKDKSKVSGDF